MKKKAKQLINHPLISGSILLVFGAFFANSFNLLFNIVMGRMLVKADFGTLSSIIAVITLPTIVANAITPLVIILAGTYFAQKQYDLIRALYIKLSKVFLVISLIFCTGFFIFIPQINSFFHIDNNILLILTDLIIFLSIMTAVNISFIQAKLAFKFYVLILCSTTIIKFIFAWFLVASGFKVIGGVAGIFLGFLIPYIMSFIPLRFLFNRSNKIASSKIDTKIFITYGIPAVIVGLGLSGFISNDLILVKHYFSPDMTGLYAGLSLLGRIIFFISNPIASVMFPLIVQQHAKKEKFTNTFLLALILILLSSIAMTVFYTLFPKFSILVVLKRDYFAIIPYLTFFSIYITIYSLVSIIGSFYLSIRKTIIAIPIIIAALLQIVLIVLFHQSIQQIITISFGLNIILLLCLLFYYPVAVRKKVDLLA